MTRRSRLAGVLALAYLAVVGILTLGPTPWPTRATLADYDVLSPGTWLDESTWTRLSSGEFVANILVFVPVGILLRVALPRATWLGATMLGGAVSLAIEVLQMGTDRVSDPRDLLANTAGAAAGAVLAAIVAGVGRLARPAAAARGVRGDRVDVVVPRGAATRPPQG